MLPGARISPVPGTGAWPGRLIPAGLFLLAVLVFSLQHPLTRPLKNDAAFNAQAARIFADGGTHHRDIFSIHPSLAADMGGAAICLGRLAGMPDILALRGYSIALGAVCVVLIWRLALGLTGSPAIGAGAAFFLMGFSGLGERLALGPEPKTGMILFGLAALFAVMRRRWFLAGAGGAAAGLCWQIGWLYLLMAILLAGISKEDRPPARRSRVLRAAAGGLLPLTAYTLYYLGRGAGREMAHQVLAAPFIIGRLERMPDILPRLAKLGKAFQDGFPLQVPVGVLGFLGAAVFVVGILRKHRGRLLRDLPGDPGTPLVLAFAGFLVYSVLDFQNWPDWIPLLPFLAVFAAILVWRVAAALARWTNPDPSRGRTAAMLVVTVLSAANLLPTFLSSSAAGARPRLTWHDQGRVASEWDRLLPPGEPVCVLGTPELLFFTGRRQVGKYLYIMGGSDASMEAFEPGGFAGWLATVAAAHPAAVTLHRLRRSQFRKPERYDRLVAWVTTNYLPLRACRAAGKGSFYLRRDLAGALPKQAGTGRCFSQVEE